jgi:DNA repair exonuclease SbcCD ATPase subunit
MFIKKLRLKNFKSISSFDQEFGTMNIMSGDNGSGKTAVLEAIAFAMTDTLQDKISEYVKWGNKKFEIDIEFEHLGHTYQYYIEGSNSTDRKLVIDGDEGNALYRSDCVKEIQKIINADIALYSNISMQGKSTQLLFEKPTARLEKFKSILGLDDLYKSIQRIDEDTLNYKSELKTITDQLSVIKNRTFTLQSIPERKDYNEIDIEIQELQNTLVSVMSKLSEVTEYDDSNLQQYLKQLNDTEKEEIVWKQKKLDYTNAVSKIATLSTQKNNLLSSLEGLVISRLKECEFKEEDIKQIDDSIILNKTNLSLIEKSIDLGKKGKCPTCAQDYIVNLDDLYTQREILENNILKDSELKKQITQGIKEYNQKIQERDIIKEKRNSIEKQIESIEKQIEDLNSVEDVENLDFTDKKKTLNDLISSEREIKVAYDLVVKENNRVTSEITKIKNDITLLTNKKITLLDQQEKEIDRIIAFNEQVKKEQKDNDKLVDKMENEILDFTKSINDLSKAKKLLDKEFSSYLIDEGTEFIKNKMNSVFSKAYGKYQVTLGKDGKGVDFLYSDNGSDLVSVNMASGYEKQLLSMSFRIALSYLHNLNVFILDEIDSDASDDNSMKLYTILFNEIKNGQFFCISHKESVKEFLYNNSECVYVQMS